MHQHSQPSSLLNSLRSRMSRSRTHHGVKRARLSVETLDNRTVPAIIGGQMAQSGPLPAQPRSSVSGFVFCDDNNNGVLDVDQGEHGIAGVTVQLVRPTTGAVVTTTQTDVSGLYYFGGVARGSYRIVETQPANTDQGQAILGTINGVVAGQVSCTDQMFLKLPAGVNAFDYNFGEICRDVQQGSSGTVEEPEPTAPFVGDCPIPAVTPTFTRLRSVLTIGGTNGGDIFRVLSNGNQLTVTFSYLNANNQTVLETKVFDQSNAADRITRIDIKGQAGADTLIVDNGGGLLGITINYNGGYGTDLLRLRNGVADSEVYTAGQAEDTGSVKLTAGAVIQTVNYRDIGLIADTVVTANLTIRANNFQQPISVLDGQVWGTASTSRVTGIHRDKKVTICHKTGSQKNPAVIIDIGRPALKAHLNNHGDVILSDEPTTTPIEFANKGNVNILGGNGSDFVVVDNPNTATGLQNMNIDAGRGRDVFHVRSEPLDASVMVTMLNCDEQSGKKKK